MKSALKYFRGNRNMCWPRGAVYLDTGYLNPEHFAVHLVVGESSMKITPEIATEILIAVSAAEKERRRLQEEGTDE